MTLGLALVLCATTVASAPSPAATATSPAGAARPRSAPAPDRSLGSAEYVAAGFPATDRAWTPADYVTAHDALARLVSERDATVLPRYGSVRSGTTFARMISRDTYAVTHDPSLALGARIEFALKGLQGLGATTKLYFNGQIGLNRSLGTELLELECILLYAGRRTMELVTELPVPAEDAPGRPQYDAGLAQMRSGLTSVVMGALVSFDEASRGPDRTRFAGCLAREVPPSIAHLTAEGQVEVRLAIRRALEAEPAASDARPRLAELADAVSKPR